LPAKVLAKTGCWQYLGGQLLFVVSPLLVHSRAVRQKRDRSFSTAQREHRQWRPGKPPIAPGDDS